LKRERTLTVPADHPAFAGHFPAMPVLPGAALLDAVLHVLEEDLALDPVEWQITTAKFLEPVRPGDVLAVEHSTSVDAIRFAIRIGGRPALTGTLSRARSDA
jgi:3-hydroxyacyl-[acyl-carrier-protein] dehydratase